MLEDPTIMLRDPSTKYRPFPTIALPDRQWPNRTITKAPLCRPIFATATRR